MKFVLSLLFIFYIFAQEYSYRGTIKDFRTKEALIGANISIKNSYEGAITDINGNFVLQSVQKEPIVRVSYIGYKSIEMKITNGTVIFLKEDLFESDIVNVYSDKYTFAQKVILNTIDKYNDLMNDIESFELNAYSKTFFYFPKTKKDIRKDDSLRRIGEEDEIRKRYPWVFESYKEVKFKEPNIINQKILKRKQGKAVPALFNVLGSVKYENVFSNEIGSFKSPLSSTNFPDFNYDYRGKVKNGNDSLFVIYAELDGDSELKFRLLINDKNYILKKFDAKFDNKSAKRFSMSPFMSFRNTKNLVFMQEYELINERIFPKNYEVNRIDSIGTIRHQEIYTNYKEIISGEKQNFDPEFFTLSSDVDDLDDTTFEKLRPFKLNELEVRAYNSSDTIYNEYSAFQRFMLFDGMKFFFFDYYLFNKRLSKFSDLYHYNPVEGHYIGLGFAKDKYKDISYDFNIGYSIHKKQAYGSLNTYFPIYSTAEWYGAAKIWKRNDILDKNSMSSQLIHSFNGLFAHNNEQNYFYNKGFEFGIDKRLSQYSKLSVSKKIQTFSPLKNTSNFSIFYKSEHFPENLNTGTVSRENELSLSFSHKEYNKLVFGPLEIDQFINNGIDFTSTVIFNANNYQNLSFKRFELNFLKKFNLSNRYRLYSKAVVHYQGKESNIYNLYFPEVFESFKENNQFSLAEDEIYNLASFDFYQLGSYLQIKRPLKYLGFRDVYINAMAYYGENYNINRLQSISLIDNKINYKVGLSVENDLLFIPLMLHAAYDSRKKNMYYSVKFELKSF